jgi:fibronectin-binding autotransporter adhesin
MASNQAPVVDRIRIIPRPDDFLDRNVGSSGEVFFNKATNSLRVYSGALAGGYELVTSDLANVTDSALLAKATTAGLAKTDLTNITDSDFLTKANQAGITASAGASIDVSESVPTTPSQGNIWLNSNTGALYVYITDVDGSQWIQPVVGISSGGGSGDSNQNAFSNFAVTGQTTIAANTTTDTVNLVAGSGMTITTSGDTITFVSSGGGGGGGGIALTDLSIVTGSANATPSLAYNNTTGVFTYTPPSIDNFITADSATEFTNKTGNNSQWTNDSNYITSYAETDTLDSVTDRGATTSNNVTVGDITANAYINAGTGSPTFTSASSITLTAPDGVISNGVKAPIYAGLIAGTGTLTVTGSGVSTVSSADNGLGDYTLTFTNPLGVDTDSFGILGNAQDQSGAAMVSFVKTSTTVIRVYVHDATGNNIDADVFITIYEL